VWEKTRRENKKIGRVNRPIPKGKETGQAIIGNRRRVSSVRRYMTTITGPVCGEACRAVGYTGGKGKRGPESELQVYMESCVREKRR